MGSRDTGDFFDTSAALAVLDRMVDRETAVLHTAASAWEAAWIACLTDSSAWRAVAQDEFAQVVVELHGVLWTVDKARLRSTSLHRVTRSTRPEISRPVTAEPLGTLHRADHSSFQSAPNA